MKVAVAFLAVLACAVAQITDLGSEIKCRKGWEAGINSCYKPMNFRVHWIEAMGYCITMESTLAEINSQEEQDAVAAILSKKPYNSYYKQFWIGLTDLSTEDQFKWARFNQNATYTSFIEGQPDNDGGKGEHCVHINALSHRNFKWNDHKCNAELNFLCEYKPLPKEIWDVGCRRQQCQCYND